VVDETSRLPFPEIDLTGIVVGWQDSAALEASDQRKIAKPARAHHYRISCMVWRYTRPNHETIWTIGEGLKRFDSITFKASYQRPIVFEPAGARHYRLSTRYALILVHPWWCHKTIGWGTMKLVWWHFHLKLL